MLSGKSMNNELHLNRRQFLRSTGQAATTLAVASALAPAILAAKAPLKTIGVGCIGLGTRGGVHRKAHVPYVAEGPTGTAPGALGCGAERDCLSRKKY